MNESHAKARPRGPIVEHSIEIQAPAELIWEILQDVNNWSSWNPIYLTASGSAGLGETVDMTVALPGMKPAKVSSKVLHSTPNEILHYGAPAFLGLMNSTRYVEIESTSSQGCVVTNGEVMAGPLGRLAHKGIGSRIRDALEQMNVGLKKIAETKWQERASPASSP